MLYIYIVYIICQEDILVIFLLPLHKSISKYIYISVYEQLRSPRNTKLVKPDRGWLRVVVLQRMVEGCGFAEDD